MSRTLEKPKPRTRRETAKLVVANGEMTDATRFGISLVAGGVTPLGLALLDAKAAQGKFDWWRKLSPYQQAALLAAIFVAAAFMARKYRQEGQFKKAHAAENVAVSAWTLVVYKVGFAALTPKDRGEAAGLGALVNKRPEDMNAEELAQLEAHIDDDIRVAAERMRDALERGQLEAAQDDVGALAIQGDDVFVNEGPDF